MPVGICVNVTPRGARIRIYVDRMKTDRSNLLRGSCAWGAILGAALVIRYVLDTFVPPTDSAAVRPERRGSADRHRARVDCTPVTG